MAKERVISAEGGDSTEERFNNALRPTRLDDYVGQPKLVERLRITLEAVKRRGEPMEHVLLHGPPGLGKTTLAHIIAAEMGAHVIVTSGPALTKPGDLVGTLTKLGQGDVLFIDEIHRLNIALEEYLYSAMEDFKIDVALDSGMHAKIITFPIKPFCLIGATTRAGLISGPMRSRFGITHNLEFYSEDDLLRILERNAKLLGVGEERPGGGLKPEAEKKASGKDGASPASASSSGSKPQASSLKPSSLRRIAQRSRGTPRIANRLLRRVRDFAQVRGKGVLTPEIVDDSLRLEGVDELGLDELDRKYLRVIGEVYRGGPVGLEAVAATLGEDAGTLEDMVEPFLLQVRFLARTRKGRMLTPAAAQHVGVPAPQELAGGNGDLFNNADDAT